MSKPLIVIADMDTAYLAELENKFLVELGDRAELEIISDPEYFEQFFSNPVTAEIVAVNENLYTNALQRQDIQNLFIYQNIRNRAEPKNYRYQEFISIMASKSYTMN